MTNGDWIRTPRDGLNNISIRFAELDRRMTKGEISTERAVEIIVERILTVSHFVYPANRDHERRAEWKSQARELLWECVEDYKWDPAAVRKVEQQRLADKAYAYQPTQIQRMRKGVSAW